MVFFFSFFFFFYCYISLGGDQSVLFESVFFESPVVARWTGFASILVLILHYGGFICNYSYSVQLSDQNVEEIYMYVCTSSPSKVYLDPFYFKVPESCLSRP